MNEAPFHFRKTISDHSGITVFGIAADGQKNGIPIGGAPAPKPTFKRKKPLALKSARLRHFAPFTQRFNVLIGYVRVSTNDQNTDLQRSALQGAGCELIFEDKMSGKTSERPGLKKALRSLNTGDTLVVWKLDRLGRSMRHLIMLTGQLRERGVNFRSLTDSIDTSTPMGRFFFHVMGALAEMERELIVERTRAGLAAARAKGRIGGRRRIMTPEVIARAERMFTKGATRQQVALVLEISEKTIYKYIPAAKQRELKNMAG